MRTVILAVFTLVLASCQTDPAARQDSALLEVRPARYEAQSGWEAFDDTISGRTVHADPQPLLTNGDIKRAIRARDNAYRLAVRLTLTDEAGDRLLEYTRKHIGQPLVITLNGELISAPIVMSGLRNDVLINGGPTGMTDELADAITGVAGQAR
jgi:preprotein translocase subunit SecD